MEAEAPFSAIDLKSENIFPTEAIRIQQASGQGLSFTA